MSTLPNPQVFISYAHDDLDTVRRLYTDLKNRGVNVWFDKEHMVPGRWKTQIQKAIPKSRFFLFCISEAALRKTSDGSGFVDDELQWAFDIAMAQDERKFTIIPVRLEDVDRGDHRLSLFQQYDLFENWEENIDKLAIRLGGRSGGTTTEEERALSEDKRLIEGLMNKAEIAYYTEQYEKALQLWESVIAINPEFAGAWSNKGAALAALSHHEKALGAINKAIGLNKEFATAWFNKGAVLSKLGRVVEAVEAMGQASELGYKFKAITNGGGN